jgi:uncharacterized protein YjdB
MNRSNAIEIEIDGVKEIYSANHQNPYINDEWSQRVLYEKKNLKDEIHEVVITNNSTLKNATSFSIDAIDINEEGMLIDPNANIAKSIEINKDSLDLKVGSSESLTATITPEEVTSKTVKWTISNPEIATVDDNGNVIGKKAGKVTITATTTDGSNLSAICQVTVKDVGTDTNRAVLRLTTTTGQLHEYDLPMTEINNFISWLDSRGQSKPYYKFSLNVTTGNVEARTEYIMYDKIVSFVVDEYK